MIERLETLPQGIEGVRASGRVNQRDFRNVVQPLFDQARLNRRRLRLLYQIDRDFRGFTPAAAVADTAIGIKAASQLERVALVTDRGYQRELSRLLGIVSPFSMRSFRLDQWSDALHWLTRGYDGAVAHRLLDEEAVLVVEPERALNAADFDALAETIDPWIELNGPLSGVVIRTRGLPGWQNLGTFLRHVGFVRQHLGNVHRVALAVDDRRGLLLERLAGHVSDVELRHFPFEQFDAAVAWARAASPYDASAQAASATPAQPRCMDAEQFPEARPF